MAQGNYNATARTKRTQVTAADRWVEGAAASRSTPSDATATRAARPTAREEKTRENQRLKEGKPPVTLSRSRWRWFLEYKMPIVVLALNSNTDRRSYRAACASDGA
jgi:hypothetical protein